MENLDYGIIGNGKTAALISRNGSLDWCCLPNFNSSSFFAKILDDEKGGEFSIEPEGNYTVSQNYIRKTNILKTVFESEEWKFELIDFMPRYKTDNGIYHTPSEIIRYFIVLKGNPIIRIKYSPKPNYAKSIVKYEVEEKFMKHYTRSGKYESLYLYSGMNLKDIAEGRTIKLEDESFILLSYNEKLAEVNQDYIRIEYERTKVYWMGWLSKSHIASNYREHIERSSLVLKLLSYQKTGAILAAATTSLPETIGEVRNWDYRFCWIRDASMTIHILSRLGHYSVARRFLQFILDIIPYKDEKIQIMYGIEGKKKLKEEELHHLSGYKNSKPVRIGNAAYMQKQNDIYGVLMDVIYSSMLIFKNTLDNVEELWTVVKTLAHHVENNWSKNDSGIWEFRTEMKHFTFSKILCWVAMDRAAKIAVKLNRNDYAKDYSKLAAKIKKNILDNGIHPEWQALTQYYGGGSMDAANLLAENYGFLSADDPLYIRTVEKSYERLCVDGLMYRYKDSDDFGIPKSSFTICSFWMARSLYKIGKKDLAKEIFEKILSYGNHLNLFSEDIDFNSHRLLGNFPQSYSHLALIDTAMVLSGEEDWNEGKFDIFVY